MQVVRRSDLLQLETTARELMAKHGGSVKFGTVDIRDAAAVRRDGAVDLGTTAGR
jgi:hypothetical protein